MRVTRPGQVFLAATALAVAGLALAPATASSSDTNSSTSSDANTSATRQTPPTWQEFKAETYRDVDGQWIVNGDEAISSVKKLHDYYDRMMAAYEQSQGPSEGGKGEPNQLVVNQSGGGDDVWSFSQVGNLTYCVSNAFGSMKSTVVNAMAGGAALWEGASSAIDFVYVSSQDANCTTSNNNVLFSVEPVQTSEYIARAFFPSSPDWERNVLVDDSLTTSGWSPSNIMGHELGHTLGFRHEHTRPESGACFEDNNWRPLTPYDSASIMHYPQCNGTSNDLSYSFYDGQGTRAVYGS
jgi:hypothetical protein